MALMGCSLKEVKDLIDHIDKVKEKIRQNKSFLHDIQHHGKSYDNIKECFANFASYLRYSEEASCESFYRVRKSEDEEPYKTVKDLKYPDPDITHEDRMNNTSFRVLYTSLHEFTAMAESRIDGGFVGKNFQLTRFSRENPLTVYRIGLFSELYLNSPRDSELVRRKTEALLGIGNHDRTIQGYSALEAAMSNILYDQERGYHVLSSILADAIFSTCPNIEAIMYPSMQNRYGINVAFNKESADALKPTYSSTNKITEVHRNGFFRYVTEMECFDFSRPEHLTYAVVAPRATYR